MITSTSKPPLLHYSTTNYFTTFYSSMINFQSMISPLAAFGPSGSNI
jgi:hypothetical protein